MRCRLTLILVFLALGCKAKAPSQEDDRLKSAIARGKWPDDEERKETKNVDPLAVDLTALASGLGGYRYTAKIVFQYEGEQGEENYLEENTTLETAADGAFYLNVRRRYRRIDDPPGESGREAVFDGKRFFTRLNTGGWIERDPLRKDHEDWRQRSTRHLPMLLAILGDAAARERNGPSVTLSLTNRSLPALPTGVGNIDAQWSEGPHWFVWWARIHRPTQLRGTIRLAENEKTVESAELEFQATLKKSRVPRRDLTTQATSEPRLAPARFTAKLKLHIAALDEGSNIKSPDGSTRAKRRRIQHMIDKILKIKP